jgi:hypothetical protein
VKLKGTEITIDVLLVLLLVSAQIIFNNDPYLMVTFLLIYVTFSIWRPLSNGKLPGSYNWRDNLPFLFRYLLILLIASNAVIIPTLTNIYERMVTPVEEDGFSPTLANLSDSALQTELALNFLVEGLNPYQERYDNTPLRYYQWLDIDDPDWEDPAYEYFVYLPGNLLLSLPIYMGIDHFDFLYDQRIIYLILYILLLLVLPQLADGAVYKLALVIGVGLNPILTKTVIVGMNDIGVLFFIVLSILMLTKRRFLSAMFLMGIACALKQYAWFMVPFFLFYLWQVSPPSRRLRQVILSAIIIGSILFISVLPFLIWDYHAVYMDTIAFPAGNAPLLYPIRGFTVGRLLMGTGIIPSFVSPFPFQLLQILFGVPLLIFLFRYQHNRSIAAMLMAVAIFIFSMGFLSRFFHENYVGVVIALATLGLLMDYSQASNIQV